MNLPLLEHVAKKGSRILLSTGMSSEEEIALAVETVLRFNERSFFFTALALPGPARKAPHLRISTNLLSAFPRASRLLGHEPDLLPTVVAVSRAARLFVERHLTLDRTMKGSDHAARLRRLTSRRSSLTFAKSS